jgi:hypothetical protein
MPKEKLGRGENKGNVWMGEVSAQRKNQWMAKTGWEEDEETSVSRPEEKAG